MDWDHAGYRREGAADPDTPVRATIVMRPRDPAVAADLLSGKYDPSTVQARVGAADDAVAAVERFARAHGLVVEESDAPARRVVVSGPVSRMSEAFGVAFSSFVSPDGARCLGYDGEIRLPSEIAPYVMAVLGLDTHPVARR
jgi:kumamolisin